MILTTTPSIEGKTITEYLCIVSADSSTRRSRSGSQGVSGAMAEIMRKAEKAGADAVVGVQFVGPTAHYYDTIHIYGTAVKLK